MIGTNESAGRQPDADTAETYTTNNTAERGIKQRAKWLTAGKPAELIRRAKRRLCRALCPDEFFNADASLEIDRLTVAVESLREQLAAARSE